MLFSLPSCNGTWKLTCVISVIVIYTVGLLFVLDLLMGIPVSDVSRKVYDNVFYHEEVDLHVSI